jgi:hypothetical protein
MGNIYIKLHLTQIFLAYFIPFSLALIFAYNNPKNIFVIYFILSLSFAVFQSFKFGGWVQYFIESTAIVLLPVALLYKKEGKSIFSTLILLFLLIYLFFMISNNSCLVSTILRPNYCAAIKNLEADEKLYNYIKNTSGNVLSDHRYLTFIAGKKISPEVFAIYELEKLGQIKKEQIYDYLEKNNVTLIAYRNQYVDLTPDWQS